LSRGSRLTGGPAPVVRELHALSARNVKSFTLIKRRARRRVASEADGWAADPSFARRTGSAKSRHRGWIAPRPIRAAISVADRAPPTSAPSDPDGAPAQPRALAAHERTRSTTNTTPQAQNLATGAGSRWHFIADGPHS